MELDLDSLPAFVPKKIAFRVSDPKNGQEEHSKRYFGQRSTTLRTRNTAKVCQSAWSPRQSSAWSRVYGRIKNTCHFATEIPESRLGETRPLCYCRSFRRHHLRESGWRDYQCLVPKAYQSIGTSRSLVSGRIKKDILLVIDLVLLSRPSEFSVKKKHQQEQDQDDLLFVNNNRPVMSETESGSSDDDDEEEEEEDED